jgi:hypothetical protein
MSRIDGPTHEAMRKASISRDVEPIEGSLLADGFEDALVGFGYQFNYPVAVYKKEKCLEILIERDGMSWEEAVEYFDFNVAGAWVGESTPVFLETQELTT